MLRPAAGMLVVLTALAGCSSSHPKPPRPTPVSAASALATLADRAQASTYTATYEFHQATPSTTAAVQVWRNNPSLRVDVMQGKQTASLIVNATGSYSCSIAGVHRACLLVAGPGAALPKPFDVAPANLFSADLHTLATETASYTISSASPAPATSAAPSGSCFDVVPHPSPGAATVPQGRYCFSTTGLLVAASFPSGNTVQLTSVQLTPPAPQAFTPYAKPTPLPTH